VPTLKLPSAETVARAGLAAAAMDAALAGVLMFGAIDRWAPPQDLFWKPLSLERPLGSATPLQLARATAEPAACRAALREAGVGFSEVADRRDGDCVTRDVVRLTGGVTPLIPARPVMTCSLALSYALWDRQVVRAQARRLSSEIEGIEHFGTYACRNIYGRADDGRSQHAFANALDVAGFRLADGRRITVSEDFHGRTPAGAFLHRVRDGACQVFGTTLSPDYNAAHRNHLHLDRSAFKLCS
jgi:hypothetical protein